MEIPDYLHGIAQEALGLESVNAQRRLELSEKLLRPSYIFKPELTVDGNQWIALYGKDLQDGVAGFGNSPEEAYLSFDKAWNKQI